MFQLQQLLSVLWKAQNRLFHGTYADVFHGIHDIGTHHHAPDIRLFYAPHVFCPLYALY